MSSVNAGCSAAEFIRKARGAGEACSIAPAACARDSLGSDLTLGLEDECRELLRDYDSGGLPLGYSRRLVLFQRYQSYLKYANHEAVALTANLYMSNVILAALLDDLLSES